MKKSLAKRIQKGVATPTSKTRDTKLQKEIIGFNRQLSKSISCPSLKPSSTTEKKLILQKTVSVFHFRECKSLFKKCRLLPKFMEINLLQIRATSTNATEKTANAVKNIGSVCACPSPSCCLPPPCNTPAKCLQYMTGYYYYPYGTWFCGPYHVSTGSCPCSGPVKPGGPCGPVLPCPGDPCGPVCCKPLTCCGVCGLGGPYQPNDTNNSYNPWHFGSVNMYSSYNTYTPYPYMDYNNSYNPYSAYTQYGYYNGFDGTPQNFGPCFNVPISPIPITHPITPEPCQTKTETSVPNVPKSSISWPLSKANINQDTKVSSSSPTPCSKNLTPKPLRPYPPPSYYSKPNLSKTNPFTKPRINARTLQPSNSIGICYFSTKCIKKYANKERKLSINKITNNIRSNKQVDTNRTAISEKKYVNNNSFNYWTLLSDENNTKSPT